MSETGKYAVVSPPLEAWVKPIECDSRQQAEEVCAALRQVCGSKFGASCGWEVLEAVHAPPVGAPAGTIETVHTVFDGLQECLVPNCCGNEVLLVCVSEDKAQRYTVDRSTVVSRKFVCATCRRELPFTAHPKKR